jgi:chromosome segregation ATPase
MADLFAPQEVKIADKFDLLDRKLQILVREVRLVKEENKELKEERRNLKASLETQRADVRNFQNQIKSSIVVSTIASGDGDITALREKIDEYVQEIERCLAHLSE